MTNPSSTAPASGSEPLPEPGGPGTVVLDVGGDIGALVVVAPPELTGEELEIRAQDEDWAGRHVAVLPRRLPGVTVPAAVFSSLTAGEYHIRRRGRPEEAAELIVRVIGGRVTEERWPA